MNLPILVVDDEPSEGLFRQHFRRDFRARCCHGAFVR
jgi:hypothetical protein